MVLTVRRVLAVLAPACTTFRKDTTPSTEAPHWATRVGALLHADFIRRFLTHTPTALPCLDCRPRTQKHALKARHTRCVSRCTDASRVASVQRAALGAAVRPPTRRLPPVPAYARPYQSVFGAKALGRLLLRRPARSAFLAKRVPGGFLYS